MIDQRFLKIVQDINEKHGEASEACTMPLHKHGAFNELQSTLSFLHLGASALEGVGAMLLSESNEGHQMNLAKTNQASAVFTFFAEAMKESAASAYGALERLEQAAAEGVGA